MAKGVDKDWKCTTIFMSQELLQTKHDSVDYENEVIHNRRFYTSGARPGKLQQHCRKGSGPHRTVSSTDLLHGHFPAHSDHIRGSQYRLEEEALEEPSEKRNSKGTKVMDVLDKEKWENARGYGAQPKEESLGFVSEQEEEEDDSSLPRTGSQTTDSDNYKQGFHCLPKSLVPSEISHCLFEVEKQCRIVERESNSVKKKMGMVHRSVQKVQDTLRTLLTYLVEDESFSDQASSSSASLVSPTPTTPTPTKTPAVPTPAQPVPAPHPHFPFHLSTPHPSCHLGVHPPPKMHFHPHYETAHAVTRRPSETCRSQLIHPQPCFLDLPTELPSCGQRREEAGAFHILTKLRESVEQLLSIQKREYEVHKEVLALVRELGPLQSHNQSYGLSAQLQQVHHQASKITKLPLLCQRCQAGLPQILVSEV